MYGLKIKVHILFILPCFFFIVEDFKKNFKENLSKCLRERLSTQSRAAASSLPEFKLFHQLQFLRDKVLNRPTVSNLSQKSAPSQEIVGKSFRFPLSPVPFAPKSCIKLGIDEHYTRETKKKSHNTSSKKTIDFR